MGFIAHKFMTYKHMNSQPQQSATSLNLLSFRRRSENTERKTSAFCPNSRSPHWEYLLPTLFLRNQLFPHGNSTFFLPASIALARNNATHRKTLASTLKYFHSRTTGSLSFASPHSLHTKGKTIFFRERKFIVNKWRLFAVSLETCTTLNKQKRATRLSNGRRKENRKENSEW